MKKIRVGVLMGGPSAEREISLLTGAAVARKFNTEKYEVIPLELTPSGSFLVNTTLYLEVNKSKGSAKELLVPNERSLAQKFDVIFIAMHGTFGEDGTIQAILESLHVPYTGSGVLASALAMHKAKAADIYRAHGFNTPHFVSFTRAEWERNSKQLIAKILKEVKLPLVLKPVDQGSTIGVSIVKTKKDLLKVVASTLVNFPLLMAQQFVRGKEATCGVVEIDGKPVALPPTHILANFNEFYDFKSKYTTGGSTHICPADFPAAVNKRIQELAVRVHQALGCSGMSRTDIFYGDDRKLWVIETNTIPGMTAMSLFPEAAEKAGISFSQLLDYIIQAALHKHYVHTTPPQSRQLPVLR